MILDEGDMEQRTQSARTPVPFVAPSQSAWIEKVGKTVGHISLGGPTLHLMANGKRVPFEMRRAAK